MFDVVRENDALVVIRVAPGCMFTGDFPHAGVRNFADNTAEVTLMKELNSRIANIFEQHAGFEPMARTEAVIDALCSFPGLDKLCRFHCSTELLHGKLTIPVNTIGFTECEPNVPDSRCTEDDSSQNVEKIAAKDSAKAESSGHCQERPTPAPGTRRDSISKEDCDDCSDCGDREGSLCCRSDDDAAYAVSCHEDSHLQYLSRVCERKISRRNSVQVTPIASPPNSPDRIQRSTT